MIAQANFRARFGGVLGFDVFFEFNASKQGSIASSLPRPMQPNENRPHYQLQPKPFFYIEEGYSMTRTEAPKDLVGRGEVNLARTTPELPVDKHC